MINVKNSATLNTGRIAFGAALKLLPKQNAATADTGRVRSGAALKLFRSL